MPRMTLDDLVAQLTAIYADELVAVALYGSAARGEQAMRHSDLNVIVIVRRITMDHLRKESPVARSWREAGNPPPLTLTRAEWLGGADIFPMEYADILAHHKVLTGTLPLEGVAVELADLRLQLEHEAMSKLLRLRHAVLGAAGDSRALLALLEDSVSTMLVLLRAALRLMGEVPPTDSEAMCERFTARSGRDTAIVRRILRHARGTEAIDKRVAEGVVEEYLSFAETFVTFVDAYSQSHPSL